MANERTVLICDSDGALLEALSASLQQHSFVASQLTDAAQLVATVRRSRPALVVVNPDMPGYDEEAVCSTIKQELQVPVILLIDSQSASRNTIGSCTADDVITKPVDQQILAFMLQNHYAMIHKNDQSSGALS